MAFSIVVSQVCIPLIISTSPTIGAGLKNFMPRTFSGLLVDWAMSVMLKVAVLVAKIVSG